MDLAKVTRIVIVRPGTISIECWANSWVPDLQDDGRTLKLFAHGDGMVELTARNTTLAEDLTRGLEQ